MVSEGKSVHKARDVIFHEDAIAPATPTLFSDESTSIDVNEHIRDQKDNEVPTVPAPQSHLTIRIPPQPAPTSPDDQGEVTPCKPRVKPERSKLVSDVPDLPLGTTRSGRQRGEDIILSAMESDPITIEEAINRPGKEGKGWEVS